MSRRRGLAVLAVAAGLVAVGAPQAGADAPTKAAWFTAAAVGPLVVPAPGLADGELRVSGSGDRPTAYATLALTAADATAGLLTLTVKPGTGTSGAGLSLVACPTKKFDWQAGGNQPFEAGPEYDCAGGSTPGVTSADGLAVEFELDETTQSAKGTWDIAIAPDPEVPTPVTVDFSEPGPEAFTPESSSAAGGGLPPPPPVTTDEPTDEEPAPAPEGGEAPTDEGLSAGSDTPVAEPETAPLEAAGPDLAGAGDPLPEAAAGEAPVTAEGPAAQDPTTQDATALPATSPVASTETGGRNRLLALLALVAVCAAAGWAAGQQRPLPQLLGGRARAVPAATAGLPQPAAPAVLERGIGRFSRVRETAPRRLR